MMIAPADIQRWASRSPQHTAMRKSVCFSVIMLLAFVVVASAFAADQPLPQIFTNARHGFNISFPAGWSAMPAEDLENANKAVEAQHPDWKRPLVHYGYVMTNSAGLAFPPYVVIRVTETSRAPEPKAVQDELEKGEELPQGVQVNRPNFDQDLNAFVQKYKASIPGAPQIEGTIACLLIKRGILKMFFYAPAAGEGGAVVPFQQIIRNVQIHDWQKFAQPEPPSPRGLVAAGIGIVAIVIALARPRPAKS